MGKQKVLYPVDTTDEQVDETFNRIKKAIGGKKLSIPLYGHTYKVTVFITRYTDNKRTCVLFQDSRDGEPFGTLTCNIPEAPLQTDEIIVKTWSENEQMVKPCLDSGMFMDTGRRVDTGFTHAQIWRVIV